VRRAHSRALLHLLSAASPPCAHFLINPYFFTVFLVCSYPIGGFSSKCCGFPLIFLCAKSCGAPCATDFCVELIQGNGGMVDPLSIASHQDANRARPRLGHDVACRPPQIPVSCNHPPQDDSQRVDIACGGALFPESGSTQKSVAHPLAPGVPQLLKRHALLAERTTPHENY
jgi:hypothetical protein